MLYFHVEHAAEEKDTQETGYWINILQLHGPLAPYLVGCSKTSITWDVILHQQLSLIVSVSFISPQRLYYFLSQNTILLKRSQVCCLCIYINLYTLPDSYISCRSTLQSSWSPSPNSVRFISGMIWPSPWTIFACFSAHCGTHLSIGPIKGWPFIIERDSSVFFSPPFPVRLHDQIQHFYGKLQSFWLMKSKDVQNNPQDPQLWRTGRGAAVLSLFPAKKGARPGNTRRKEKSRFSAQKSQRTVSLQAVGKWRKTFSTCRRKQYLLGLFFPLPLDA